MKFQNKGAVLVEIALLFISKARNQNQSIAVTPYNTVQNSAALHAYTYTLSLSPSCKDIPHDNVNAATHCNTIEHSATLCNTLQHTATHRHTAAHCSTT